MLNYRSRVAVGLFALLVGVTAARAADPPGKAAKGGDRAKLIGKWQAVSGERAGKPMTAKECKAFHIVIDKEYLTFVFSDTSFSRRHTYEIDSKADPKAIDLQTVDTRAPFDSKGIYSLDGDTLKVCVGRIRGKRPAEFATKGDGPGSSLYVLKRQ